MLRWEWRTAELGEDGMDLQQFSAALPSWMAAHRRSHTAFLATCDETPAGMAWIAVVDRIPGPRLWRRRCGHVQSVYVRPALRNRGIGTALMRAVIDHAVSMRLDYLALHAAPDAVAFYRRLGFGERADALELELRPNPPTTSRPAPS